MRHKERTKDGKDGSHYRGEAVLLGLEQVGASHGGSGKNGMSHGNEKQKKKNGEDLRQRVTMGV